MRDDTAAQLGLSLAYLAIVGLMREAGDGPAGFLPLLIVPVLWLALYGTLRQLLIALGAMALVLLVPVGADRGPALPRRTPAATRCWRLTVAALAGLTIQRLLGEARTGHDQLLVARDFTDAVLETAGSLVIVTDRDARIECFNRAAEQISGSQRTTMLGRSLIDVLMPAEAERRLSQGARFCPRERLPAPL